jgi:biotin carboxyl carrier protein
MARKTFAIARDGEEPESRNVDLMDDGRVRVGDATLEVQREPEGAIRVGADPAVRCWTAIDGDTRWVFADGRVYEFFEQRPQASRRKGAQHGALTAPMPATVRRVLVRAGDAVKPGDSLMILEAMKMELPVRAAAAGTIKAINCREGELVQPGVPLVEIEPS